MTKRKLAKAAALGLLGAAFSLAAVGAADAHRMHHRHHSPYFVRLVGVGHVSYPIYRIDHYKVDYTDPTYVYDSGW